MAISSPTSTSYSNCQNDLDTAITLIRTFDPSGYLPGLLSPPDVRKGYFAVRSFFVASQLKASDLSRIIGNHSRYVQLSNTTTFLRDGISQIYTGDTGSGSKELLDHPTLRLLRNAVEEYNLSPSLLYDIINAREDSENQSQFDTFENLIKNAQKSHGTSLKLTLECHKIHLQNDDPTSTSISTHNIFNATAQDVGTAMGISSLLRDSVPLASHGRIILPADLCQRFGVRNPRYLLSLLGRDDQCQPALRQVVQEMVRVARVYLDKARKRREMVLEAGSAERLHGGNKVALVFLPGIAAETFFSRLERSGYDLTDQSLKNVGFVEHALCGSRMFKASLLKRY